MPPLPSPTFTRDGFTYFRSVRKAHQLVDESLIVDPSLLKQLPRHMAEHGITSLVVNPFYFELDDLSFLADLPVVESLAILQDDLDLSPINGLHGLRSLRIERPRQTIDFANFARLQILGIRHGSDAINIGSCSQLWWLWIDGYRSDDLRELATLTSLRFLSFVLPRCITLEGVEHLEALEELHIDDARRLTSSRGLAMTNGALRLLDIFGARKLVDYTAIAALKALRWLRLGRTGDIPSLSFLVGLTNLRTVKIGSRVIDGDLSIMKRIPYGGFVNHPHYNLTMKEWSASHPRSGLDSGHSTLM